MSLTSPSQYNKHSTVAHRSTTVKQCHSSMDLYIRNYSKTSTSGTRLTIIYNILIYKTHKRHNTDGTKPSLETNLRHNTNGTKPALDTNFFIQDRLNMQLWSGKQEKNKNSICIQASTISKPNDKQCANHQGTNQQWAAVVQQLMPIQENKQCKLQTIDYLDSKFKVQCI